MYPHERTLVNELQGRPFALLGVNNDRKISTVKKAIRENNINWRSWYDGKGGPIVKEFGVRSFPTVFLVDHTGVIRKKGFLRGKKLDEALEQLVIEAEEAGMSGAPVIASKHRRYEDVTGKHHVFGRFHSFDNNQIVLLKRDGSKVELPLDKLCKSDQGYLEENGYLTETVSTEVANPISGKAAEPDDDAQEDEAMPLRLFVDSTGKFKIEATLVEVKDENVVLRKDSGEEISLPIKRLSQQDQKYVREQTPQ